MLRGEKVDEVVGWSMVGGGRVSKLVGSCGWYGGGGGGGYVVEWMMEKEKKMIGWWVYVEGE